MSHKCALPRAANGGVVESQRVDAIPQHKRERKHRLSYVWSLADVQVHSYNGIDTERLLIERQPIDHTNVHKYRGQNTTHDILVSQTTATHKLLCVYCVVHDMIRMLML